MNDTLTLNDADDPLRIVIAGHVDHGKSTLIGRLFNDTGSLPRERYEEIRQTCERQGRAFEFAYLTDALEEERVQNITIDTAQSFFHSDKRHYVIIDAPGHKEFLKNMVTGASAADAAVLLVDAVEGVQEQTRRHAYILSLLGLEQLVVVVNKLDAAGFRQELFHKVHAELARFLHSIGLTAAFVIPCSAREGDNIVQPSARTPWYAGPTVLGALDAFEPRRAVDHLPLRLPIQDVYVWDRKRVYGGRVETGVLHAGQRVVLRPSGKRTRIATLERWGADNLQEAASGESVGVTLADELFIERGEVVCGEPTAAAASELRASIFWLGPAPLRRDQTYLLKLGTDEVEARVASIEERIDSSTLHVVERHASEVGASEVANAVLSLRRPVAVDGFDQNPLLGRFVLSEHGRVAGGGIIREARTQQLGRATRLVRLDSVQDTEPDGNLVDLTAETGGLELSASSGFLDNLARGERVLFKVRGAQHIDVLARFAFEHDLSLRFSRHGETARALLYAEQERQILSDGEVGP
jgi:bifunctional enzyme CysN/CysC/sulfate adenylyltransferase subunit 1